MDITKQYEKACEAVERGNDEYAIKLFQEILTYRPEHLESRQKLRDSVKRKFRKEGVKSAGAAAYAKGIVPLVRMHVYTLTKKFDLALHESEKFLALDPDNVVALSNLGKAATAILECIPTAVWVYESILEQRPNDVKTLRILGDLYEMLYENDKKPEYLDKASGYYERLLRVKPDAREVETKLRDLAARKTIKKGWDRVNARDKGAFTEVLRDGTQMEDQRAGEDQVIRTEDDLDRNLKRVKGDIEKEPNSKKLVIQLGDLYRRGKRYDEAKAEYLNAKRIDANDGSIDERLGDLQIEVFDVQIDDLQEEIRKETAPQGSNEKVAAMAAERDRFATKEYAARVKVRPTDLPLRYRLGVLLYNAADIDGAFAEFQQARNSPQFRRSATTYCGMCLYKKGMFDLSVQMFEDAVKDSVTVDHEQKNILYNLGLAAEKMGDLKKAEAAYKKLFNADINYRDVNKKIEELYKKARGSDSPHTA